MNLIKIKKSFYELCELNGVHEEMLHNKDGRPCVLIVKLKYKGLIRDFVIPLRSNISPTTPFSQYFKLPPNPTTKPEYHHGVHYLKIFPIHKSYIDKYNISGDKYYSIILNMLDKSESIIISACQEHLNKYETGNKNPMSPNIDGIIAVIDKI